MFINNDCFLIYHCSAKGRLAPFTFFFFCLPPCLESQSCQFDPSCLSPFLVFCLVLLLFLSYNLISRKRVIKWYCIVLYYPFSAIGPFTCSFIPKNLVCLKDCFFLVWLLWLLFGQLGDEHFCWWYGSLCSMAVLFAMMHLYSILKVRLLLSILFFIIFKILYWNSR